jgi:chaperonin GroES
MKLKPLGDRLIVRAIEEEETAGLLLPDTAKEKPQKGKVLAVGDGKLDDSGKRIPLDVKADDEVLYSKYGGTEIKVDGEDLLVLRESDVLGREPVAVYGRRESSLVGPEEAKQLDDLRQDVQSKITRLRALAK